MHIESDPERGVKQNVTAVYRVIISMDLYNAYKNIGSKMSSDGGEENEVSDVWLMPLTPENIETIDWAFNHKKVAREIYNNMKHYFDK